MQERLSLFQRVIGLPEASPFARSLFARIGEWPAESQECLLADLAALKPAFEAVPYRYCETLADEFARELRRACGPDATAEEIAEVVGPRSAVEQFAAELLRRLTAAMRNRRDSQPSRYAGHVATLCAYLCGEIAGS